VGYYLDANNPQTVQRAVGIAQIILELLVHAVLVDSGLKTAMDVKPTSRGISELLRHFNIPVDIPAQFGALATEAQQEGWQSGPWTLTELRNEVIHAKRQAKDRALEVWIQAWKLGVW
jgi:hypothetical protein